MQGLADQTSAVTFGAVEEAIGLSLQEPEEDETPIVDAAEDEGEDEDYETEEKEIDYRFVDTDDDGILLPFVKSKPGALGRRPRTPGTGAAGFGRPAGNCWIMR